MTTTQNHEQNLSQEELQDIITSQQREEELMQDTSLQIHPDNQDDDLPPRVIRPLDDMVDADEQLGLQTLDVEDHEVESPFSKRGWICDGCDVSQPYYTKSGDNPVIMDQAYMNDQRDRNLNETLAPVVSFYSSAKPLRIKRSDLQRTQVNYQTVIGFIFKNKENRDLLKRAALRFVSRCNTERHFVTSKQRKLVMDAFNRLAH